MALLNLGWGSSDDQYLHMDSISYLSVLKKHLVEKCPSFEHHNCVDCVFGSGRVLLEYGVLLSTSSLEQYSEEHICDKVLSIVLVVWNMCGVLPSRDISRSLSTSTTMGSEGGFLTNRDHGGCSRAPSDWNTARERTRPPITTRHLRSGRTSTATNYPGGRR